MFYAGVDLGQKHDHTAIAVVEKMERWRPYGGNELDRLVVRHVERVPLGTPYPEVVARVQEIVWDDALQGQCVLVVDATGVGNPVVDMLRAARLQCEITAVTITNGNKESSNGQSWSVPKQDLIAGVQVMLEKGELKIAKGLAELGPLVQELVDMKMTRSDKGRVRMGAEGHGEHDDLVIALALAVWRAKRKGIGWGGGRLPGF
jgi:hypothetical protein